jgi:hypothetical protein
MFQQDLKTFVENNTKLVKVRPAGDGIFVLKYSKKVFYDALWNDYLEHCRGTIVDRDFNIVSYPFHKIYNYGVEAKAPTLSDDVVVDAYRKVNGFMVAVTWHNGDILVSTTGSTDSDFVLMAKELIGDNLSRFRNVCEQYSTYTFMFECVHHNDPHIIPETEGMYYLGHRAKSWGSKVGVSKDMPSMFGCYGAEHMQVSMAELKKLVKNVRHEGFVFYTDDGVSAKIKSPWYLTNKWVARNPRTDKLVDLKNDIKKNIDEEYYKLIDAIRANIEEYTAMDEQARLAWVRKTLEVV